MTFTLILQGVIVGVADTFEEAERLARNSGVETLIECPNGTVLEFVMGWYRQVGQRTELFKLAQTLESPEDEFMDYATGQGRR